MSRLLLIFYTAYLICIFKGFPQFFFFGRAQTSFSSPLMWGETVAVLGLFFLKEDFTEAMSKVRPQGQL